MVPRTSVASCTATCSRCPLQRSATCGGAALGTASATADLVALGQSALANRNWPERVRTGAPLQDRLVPLKGGFADVKAWETDADTLLARGDTAH